MYLYIITLLFIIIIIILIIFFNNKQIENFSCPSERVGYTCILDNKQFGICNDILDCTPFVNPVKTSVSTGSSSITSSESSDSSSSIQPIVSSEPTQPDTCIANQNFDTICKSFNSNYGIKSINTKNCFKGFSEIICGDNYINGIDYSNSKNNMNIVKTPCMNKNIDFDTMCKYYNTSAVPTGYTINSIGASNILVGKKGDCYLNNGESDPNSARAICNYNNIGTVPKLNRAYNKLNYNKFTECKPIRSDFNTLCLNVLEKKSKKSEDVTAVEIMGYDCLPGFARAKCVYRNDLNNTNYGNDNLDGIFNDSNLNYFEETSLSSFSKCNC